MDWLRNNIGAHRSGSGFNSLQSTQEECDPTACYDSFKQHWQQALKIIKRNQEMPSHDDVLGVVNHLEQMLSLLLYDVKKFDQITLPISNCLEYLISENILDKLYEWGIRAGIYANAVKVELLKLYEMLISQSRHLLLVHESFLRPLLKILDSYLREVLHQEVEKRLVTLLYQLCIVLMQNIDLVDLFFPNTGNGAIGKFLIVELLISFVHRDDNIGMQARDALLLCMSLSKKNHKVKDYIADNSPFCQLLVTGLGGLYSVLPLVLSPEITLPDWHRLTPDNVNEIKSLSLFVTSLEFCNLVSQVAHPVICKQLQDFMYRGFLIPVFGAALLQSLVDEQVAVTAYLEIMLRTVTSPGLLHPCLMFILRKEYDDQLVFDILMDRLKKEEAQPNQQRIKSNAHLCLVSLALFESLVDLNCEDVMLQLIYQHLQPCLHLMISQRKTLLPLDPHCQSFEKFLNLSPVSCTCETATASPVAYPANRQSGHRRDQPRTAATTALDVHWNHYGGHSSLYGNYHAYLCDARNKINACQTGCSMWTHEYTGCETILISGDTTLTDEITSLSSSLGDSSGYESLKIKQEIPPLDHEKTPQNIHYSSCQYTETTDHFNQSGTGAGPFLTTLLHKLQNMLNNSFYINLHLTGLISRLAVFPQPLLRTYLLDHSLILQPNVPSLYQIIGSLKHTIDEFLNKQPDRLVLIHQARSFLLEREIRLVNARKNAKATNSTRGGGDSYPTSTTATTRTSIQSHTDADQSFQRHTPKRRSLTLSSFSNMFTRRLSGSTSDASMQMTVAAQSGDGETAASSGATKQIVYPKFTEAQHVAICAVLLDEWVKELAALAQEHTISQLAALFK